MFAAGNRRALPTFRRADRFLFLNRWSFLSLFPSYNEEENVEPLISEIECLWRRWKKAMKIVVVDDGSKDGTFLK